MTIALFVEQMPIPAQPLLPVAVMSPPRMRIVPHPAPVLPPIPLASPLPVATITPFEITISPQSPQPWESLLKPPAPIPAPPKRPAAPMASMRPVVAMTMFPQGESLPPPIPAPLLP